MLKKTSPDRRYIALIRRSRSYREEGRTDDALRDLAQILVVEDIAASQKSEARLQRGMLYRQLGKMTEAAEDLEAVCSSDELFPGMFRVHWLNWRSWPALPAMCPAHGSISTLRPHRRMRTRRRSSKPSLSGLGLSLTRVTPEIQKVYGKVFLAIRAQLRGKDRLRTGTAHKGHCNRTLLLIRAVLRSSLTASDGG
jgi:hypothetical protein